MIPIRDQALMELRHNLRTPINHILGFTEMLMEDATDMARTDLLDDLARIHRDARRLLAQINERLSRDEVSHDDLRVLCEELKRPVDEIVHSAQNVRERTRDLARREWDHDLEKITGASGSLLDMMRDALHPTEDTAPEPGAKNPSVPGKARLLVVDDNDTNRNMLRRRLERQGYSVAEAADGVEALRVMREERFDLVLLDIMMPGMDGHEVLRRIRADTALRELPVIVVSAVDEMESVVRCIELGAEDYLLKPFDPVLLRARVSASLEKRRLRSELLMHEKLASLGALTAGIAHEIKNPLNFVTNFAEISADLAREVRQKLRALEGTVDKATLADLLDAAADLEQNVEKIREHGARADSIIRNMLMHSRGRSGERREMDLNALLAEYINLAYHGLRARDATFNATIDASYDPAIGTVCGIPQDLSRVFLNIAANAFASVHEKKKRVGEGYQPVLRISTKARNAAVEIRIRDNGGGIPARIRDRIFDPFFTTKPVGEGTGLGLSISYDIVVQEHGGEMRVESEEGEYAEFIMTIPRDASHGARA